MSDGSPSRLTNRTASRAAARLVASLLCCAQPGCTLLGAAGGAGIDSLIPGPYETRDLHSVRLARDDRVRLILQNGARVEGQYRGTQAPDRNHPEMHLLIETDDGTARIATSDIRTLGVEVQGNGWLYGGFVGLAIDATLLTAAVIALNNLSYQGAWGDQGCFC